MCGVRGSLSINTGKTDRLSVHPLCMLSVREIFVGRYDAKELQIYAPHLTKIHFHLCQWLRKLIMLDRMPAELSKIVTPLEEPDENDDGSDKLKISFSHYERHDPEYQYGAFQVIKNPYNRFYSLVTYIT